MSFRSTLRAALIVRNSPAQRFTSTTSRPRTRPASISGATVSASASAISRVIDSSLPRSRPFARRLHASERTSLGAALTYKFSREFWLKAEARQERLRSNVPGVDYDANIVMLGLKMQR